MGNLLTPALTVTSCTSVRRRRDLPIAGEILVKVGDVVTGSQIVARAQLEGELRLVRVAESLGVPAAEIAAALKVKEGDQVVEGDVIAEVSGLWGLFRSSVTAPLSGTIEFISSVTGHVGVRAPSKPLELTAYIAGEVVSIEPSRSVVIEAQSTLVQGIFGVGGERLGTVAMLPIAASARVTERDIPDDVRGRILVGGHSPTNEALAKASDGGAMGLITGSIDDGALRRYVGYDIGVALTGDEPVSMTLVITEGFGELPMSERVLETLRRVNGQVASLNGATQVRAGAQRPEIIAPMVPSERSVIAQEKGLSVGARIRVVRVPFFGSTGAITELPHELQRIETGAEVRVLRALLDDGRQVTVPRANVELV